MQGKKSGKMPLGTAFVLLLTLQGLQLVSTQTTNPGNKELTPSLVQGIPDEWKRENNINLTEDDLGISSGSMTFSGDDEYQAFNQTVIAVTGQYDNYTITTASPQTTDDFSNNTLSLQNDTSNLVTLNPSLEPATANDSDVNLTEFNTTTPGPGNSTTATTTINNATSTVSIDQNSTSKVSENFTTTSPLQGANYTKSPSENSANTTVSTTTTMQTSASTTEMNNTGGLVDFRGNMDRDLASNNQQQSKTQAWGAILGIGVGVAIVALVILIIVKRRNYRDFSHRKLVEDMPPEPVLRLDNSEPLDLKFDGFAYYNPGLQGDNIQMTNFPQGHTK